MTLERKLPGKSAKSIFYEDKNDIDIFIEDTEPGYEKIFQSILSRVLKEEYRIEKVFPLGGRDAVLSEYKHSSDKTARPVLYIIDGDLHLLCKNRDYIESGRGLYVLPVYCIENIICDPSAIGEILNEEDAFKNFSELAADFGYEGWAKATEDLLYDLFIEYAVSFFLETGNMTVAYKVNNIVANKFGELSKEKISKRINEVRESTIERVGADEYHAAKENIVNGFESSGLSKLDIVSGKDYIFPLLNMRLRSTVETKISNLSLKLRLSMKCEINKISDLKGYVAV